MRTLTRKRRTMWMKMTMTTRMRMRYEDEDDTVDDYERYTPLTMDRIKKPWQRQRSLYVMKFWMMMLVMRRLLGKGMDLAWNRRKWAEVSTRQPINSIRSCEKI
jgi:hypothetical protein